MGDIIMENWITMIKEDINQEEGKIITAFTHFTTYLFKAAIFVAVPIFLYAIFTF
jgi:hypothetical protein